jgi:hypothetical protein
MTDDARFDRLEAKIDRLTDAVAQIARVEEKILAANKRQDRFEFRLDGIENEVEELTRVTTKNTGVAAFADKLFWVFTGAGVSVATFLVR